MDTRQARRESARRYKKTKCGMISTRISSLRYYYRKKGKDINKCRRYHELLRELCKALIEREQSKVLVHLENSTKVMNEGESKHGVASI